MPDFLDQFNNAGMVIDAAQQYGVRPELAGAVMRRESNGMSAAVSPKGAIGAMQVMPSTAAQPGYGVQPFDPNDPQQNVRGGVQLLKAYIDHFGGDEAKGLAAYNAGPGRVERGGPLPAETQAYVPAVQAGAQGAAQTPPADDFLARFNAAGDVKPPAPPEEKSLGGFVQNAITSTGHVVGGMAHAVMHPIDTVTQLAKTAAGGAEMIPGVGDAITSVVGDHKADAQALIDAYKAKYGSLDALKETLYHDPAGAALDATMVLDPLAGGLKMAGLGGAARAVAKVSDVVNPISKVSDLAGATIGKAATAIPEKLMASALKIAPDLQLKNPNVNFARTALDEGINASRGGFDKATGIINDIQKAKEALPAQFPGTVTDFPYDALAGLHTHLAKVAEGAAPAQDIGAVQDLITQLENHPSFSREVFQNVQVPGTRTVQVPTGAQNNAGLPITQSQVQPFTTTQRVSVGRVPTVASAEDTFGALRAEGEKTKGTYGPALNANFHQAEKVGRKIIRNAASNSLKDAFDPKVAADNAARTSAQVAIDYVRGTTPKTFSEMQARQSPLLALQKGLRKRLGPMENANVLPLTSVVLGAGGVAGGLATSGAGIAIGKLLADPKMLSILARGINAPAQAGLAAGRAIQPLLLPAAKAGRVVDMRDATTTQVQQIKDILARVAQDKQQQDY